MENLIGLEVTEVNIQVNVVDLPESELLAFQHGSSALSAIQHAVLQAACQPGQPELLRTSNLTC